MADGKAGLADRATAAALILYGLAATLCGLVMTILPLRATQAEVGASADFLVHLNQSRGASVLGLGLIALGAARSSDKGRAAGGLILHMVLTAAMLFLMQFTPAVLIWRWGVIALLLGCAALMSLARPMETQSDAPLALPFQIMIGSYIFFTAATGLLWIIAPTVMGATFAAIGGAPASYIGAARGAADLSIACVAWGSRQHLRSSSGRAVLGALFVANLCLSAAGIIAQIGAIASPSRWLVQIAHMLWCATFLLLFVRAGRPQSE